MQIEDKGELRGEFSLTITRKNGEIIEQFTEKNLILNGAKNQLARLIGSEATNRHITHIGFGGGVNAASPGDTSLNNAFFKPVTTASYPATGQVAFKWSLSTAEANGIAITEFGLRCADGTLFARKVRAPITKSDDISITGTWIIIF